MNIYARLYRKQRTSDVMLPKGGTHVRERPRPRCVVRHMRTYGRKGHYCCCSVGTAEARVKHTNQHQEETLEYKLSTTRCALFSYNRCHHTAAVSQFPAPLIKSPSVGSCWKRSKIAKPATRSDKTSSLPCRRTRKATLSSTDLGCHSPS